MTGLPDPCVATNAVGMSATPAETIVEAQWVAERRALYRVRGEQCLYSIFNRAAERAVFGAAQRYGLGVLTYGPLCGGWLSGKYRRGADLPEGSRALGPLGRNERVMLAVFSTVLVLWLSSEWHGASPTAIAYLGLALLLVTRVLDWQDVLAESGRHCEPPPARHWRAAEDLDVAMCIERDHLLFHE